MEAHMTNILDDSPGAKMYCYVNSDGNIICSDNKEEMLTYSTHTGMLSNIKRIELPKPPCQHKYAHQRATNAGTYWWCSDCAKILEPNFTVKEFSPIRHEDEL